jgi:monovalent cation/hydrogen antiporter
VDHLGPLLLALLLAVAGLAALAHVLRVPYPITLVVGGLALGFVPGMPSVELDPDLVLLLFLPPLLYSAAFFSSLRELRANVGPISLLSIGLVVLTTLSVAAAAHFAIGLPWPVAFVLGAVVSPTDAVAPAAIVRRLGVPRRVVTVIEGESLTNDWTALVVYRFAVAAVITGSFRGDNRVLLTPPCGPRVRADWPRRARHRTHRRLARRPCAPAPRRSADRNGRLAAHRLRGLHPG